MSRTKRRQKDGKWYQDSYYKPYKLYGDSMPYWKIGNHWAKGQIKRKSRQQFRHQLEVAMKQPEPIIEQYYDSEGECWLDYIDWSICDFWQNKFTNVFWYWD